MTQPASPPVTGVTSEPVLIAHAFTAVLALGVGLGWWVFPSQPTVDAICSVVALIVSLAATMWARGQVSPAGAQPVWLTDLEQTITEIATEVAQQQIDSYVARGQ